MTKNAAVFDVIGNVPSDLVDMVNTIIHAINEVAEDREEFVRRTITHWQTAKPDYNVVVLNNKWHHDVTIQNGVHYHVEIPRQVAGTHGFDVYVFKVRRTIAFDMWISISSFLYS
jgi:hypothetical protein